MGADSDMIVLFISCPSQLLYSAAERGHVKEVDSLLSSKADINGRKDSVSVHTFLLVSFESCILSPVSLCIASWHDCLVSVL